MILLWLASDFREIFERHPEVRVILWFDEREEFRRVLLPAKEHLQGEGIDLLCYDPDERRGQVWLRWNIEAGPKAEAPRIVLWLPCARELVHRARGSEIRFEALLEYEYSGKVWLVDGKKPTLFLFLRKHGVLLPDSRAEQDLLWRGGRDSLLAKYVGKFADRDEAFWRNRITGASIEASLVGDVNEQILLVLADPEGATEDIRRRGLLGEFLGQVCGEYGWKRPLEEDPVNWARDFAATAALCEIHEATGRPANFPFTGRLPNPNTRERWLHFLREWMGSRDHEPTFRRWMCEVEAAHDLSGWTGRLDGNPQAFKKLAAERWDRWYRELGDICSSKTHVREFLAREHKRIQTERRGFWAEAADGIPGWGLASHLADLAERCREVIGTLDTHVAPTSLVQAYAEEWWRIDSDYWMLLAGIRKADNVERLRVAADAFYGEYLEETSRRFRELVRDTEGWPPAGCPSVRELAQTLWSTGPTPRAVLVIDALRYDLGRVLASTSAEAQVHHVVTHVPSETSVGMTGLLPCSDVRAEVDERGRVRLMSAEAEGDLVQRQVRWHYLRSRYEADSIGPGGKPADLSLLLDRDSPPKPLPRLLVIMDREIDQTAHAMEQEVLHHFDVVLQNLGKAVLKLLRWGYPEVHIVTDHGFVLLGSSLSPNTMCLNNSAIVTASARYAILKAGAVVEGATLPLSLDPRHRLLLAPGLRCFKDPVRFFHGGATLQEVVIPHIVFRRAMDRPRMRVRPLVSETEIRTLTFKVELVAELPPARGLFDEKPLPVTVRVFLGPAHAPRSTVKEVEVRPDDQQPLKVLVHLQPPLSIGEELAVHVVDAETDLEFAENLGVRVARDFR
ncbi:MAG: PglZ domain-containing protein [Planctomycetota bacterium]